jgi:choline dehydrogenase
MNFLLPPDDEWKRIADLTGDDSWLPDNMRQYFMELERNRFVEEGTLGHGFDGYISVWLL